MSAVWRMGWFRALLAVELMVALAVTAALWSLRAQTVDGEQAELQALARAMALLADRSFGEARALLDGGRRALAQGEVAPQGPAVDELLRRSIVGHREFARLALLDANGRVLASAGTALRPAAGVPLLDVPADLAHRGDAEALGARIDAQRLQIHAGTEPGAPPWLRAIRGWRQADGTPGGTLVLDGAGDLFEGGFARLTRQEGFGLALLDRQSDAAVPAVGGVPFDARALARLREALAASDDVDHSLAALLRNEDGSDRLTGVAGLQHAPLAVLVWRDAGAALSEWRDAAWLTGLFAAAMLVVSAGLAWRASREQLRSAQLAQQLDRARKLEALGQLAGGVAHDFNNVLAALIGHAEIARDAAAGAASPPGVARHLDQVLQAGLRGRQLVDRILAFSRGQPRRQMPVRLQPIVEEVLSHLGPSLPAGVQVQPALDGPALVVLTDPAALYEAVMNLCHNACLAMPQGGALRVALAAEALAAARPAYDGVLPPGRYARLDVEDEGTGMSPEVMRRLFEPFFTTRSGRGGTGLGLAVVHAVVRDALGGIDVRSQPGAGTRFTLWLPLSDAPAEPAMDAVPVAGSAAASARPADPLPMGQGQTVLIVDDEPELVALAEELLAGLGYEPLGTTSSAEALEAVRREPGRFDLVLSDEVMPGLGGADLAAALRALRADLPVVLVTGYGGEDLEARAAAAGVREIAAKPLRREELARVVARVLGAAGR